MRAMRLLSMALRTGDSPQQIAAWEGSWEVEPPPALALVCDVQTPGLLLLGNKWSSSCSTSRFQRVLQVQKPGEATRTHRPMGKQAVVTSGSGKMTRGSGQ
ncbi:hypothetical protein LEMLEM_LOCUS20868 [Lemmus lemmus]